MLQDLCADAGSWSECLGLRIDNRMVERGGTQGSKRGWISYISLVLDEAEHAIFLPTRELQPMLIRARVEGGNDILRATAGVQSTKAKGAWRGTKGKSLWLKGDDRSHSESLYSTC